MFNKQKALPTGLRQGKVYKAFHLKCQHINLITFLEYPVNSVELWVGVSSMYIAYNFKLLQNDKGVARYGVLRWGGSSLEMDSDER